MSPLSPPSLSPSSPFRHRPLSSLPSSRLLFSVAPFSLSNTPPRPSPISSLLCLLLLPQHTPTSQHRPSSSPLASVSSSFLGTGGPSAPFGQTGPNGGSPFDLVWSNEGPSFGPVWSNGGPLLGLAYQAKQNDLCSAKQDRTEKPLFGLVWPNDAEGGANAEEGTLGRCRRVGRRWGRGERGAGRGGDVVLGEEETGARV